MTNERLRTAMAAAQTDLYQLATKVQVDPKSVQRWLAGRLPHPRHRWSVAQLLGQHEDYLWPDAYPAAAPGAVATPEVVAAYAHRADFPTAKWRDLFARATKRIDLLGYAMLHLSEQQPDLPGVLRTRCEQGCTVRIALADPESRQALERDSEEQLGGSLLGRIRTSLLYLRPLLGCSGAELRYHATPMYNSVFRFDDEMLVTPHLHAVPGYSAPLLHIRRLGPNGLFAGFAAHFDSIWTTASPIAEDLEPARTGT